MAKISVVIPSIPPRRDMLASAVRSVCEQDHPVEAIHVALDYDKAGAAINRDKAFEYVDTEWVAFLDDDDTMHPYHLRTCLMAAESSGADLLYPWFDMNKGGTDPFPFFFRKPWDNDDPHQIPVTFVAKTDVIRAAGGFSKDWPPTPDDPEFDELGNRAGEDYRLVLRLVAMGAKIVHHPERTWKWNHHGKNTSGLPSPVVNPTDVCAVIPSRNREAMLVELLRDLRANGVPATQTLVVDNGAAYDWEAIGGAQWTRWDGKGDRNISAWWNLGIDFANGRPLLVLNDDVRLPPNVLGDLVQAMNADGSSIAHPDLSGQLTRGTWVTEKGLPPLGRNLFYRLTGWCFLMRGAPDELRADESLRWWYGDDDLEWKARLEGGVTRVGGTAAERLDADGWVREYGDELMPLTHEDRARFVAKWGREPW